MYRKLLCAVSLLTVVAVVAGCKDDKPTSMNFDAKGAYSTPKDYTKGAGTGGNKDKTTP
jgi:hypothetical protein